MQIHKKLSQKLSLQHFLLAGDLHKRPTDCMYRKEQTALNSVTISQTSFGTTTHHLRK